MLPYTPPTEDYIGFPDKGYIVFPPNEYSRPLGQVTLARSEIIWAVLTQYQFTYRKRETEGGMPRRKKDIDRTVQIIRLTEVIHASVWNHSKRLSDREKWVRRCLNEMHCKTELAPTRFNQYSMVKPRAITLGDVLAWSLWQLQVSINSNPKRCIMLYASSRHRTQ